MKDMPNLDSAATTVRRIIESNKLSTAELKALLVMLPSQEWLDEALSEEIEKRES